MGLGLLICVVFIIVPIIHGLNLDPRFSVVKTGPENSYFGFSLAQHQVTVESSSPPVVKSNLLVVGAPKERKKVNNNVFGGTVYRCNMNSKVSCDYITDGVYDEPSEGDVEDDRWLGVSVASQGTGGKVVACAHRDIRNNAALGYCQVFTNDFDDSLNFQPCLKQPHTRFLQDFGLCQAGMSAALSKDYSVIMGAPGSLIWRGVVFVANVSDALGVTWEETPSPFDEPGKEGTAGQLAPTTEYSYNGYAATTGKFDATKELVYVSGAPMSKMSGEVTFFRHPKNQKFLRYEPNQILKGPVAFSGFGFSLLAMDINNDGFDDLIVGAPFFFAKKTGGAFYVYLGGKTMISNETKPTEVRSRKMSLDECKELQCENARFGISLATLGDVNMDGFNDFAVGAPYEGNGVVYIYYGDDSEAGFNTEHIQRITSESMPDSGEVMKSFGYSLSGGMDLDANGYPDLAVGAYESNRVALIRARPIIKLHPNITVDPTFVNLEKPKGCTELKSDRQCITLDLCLNFTTTPEDSIQTSPKVYYRLEAEPQRQNARVELHEASDDTKRVISGKHMMLLPDESTCTTLVAFVKDKSDIDDMLNAILFTFTFDLKIDEDDIEPFPENGLQDVNLFPVLDTQGTQEGDSNSVTVQADFVKECGPDNKCESNLQFTATFQNLTQNADGNFEIEISGEETFLRIDMSVINLGESAYQTGIYVQKPANITFDDVEAGESSVTCSGFGLDYVVCGGIGNPLRPGKPGTPAKPIEFTLRLKVNRVLAGSVEPYHINAWVNTSSTETTKVNDNHTLSLKLLNKADIFIDVRMFPDRPIICRGELRGANAIADEIGIGAAVRHTYSVSNKGPGQIAESYLTIYWPYEVADSSGASGKHLLYLMRKPMVTSSPKTSLECNDDEIQQYVNPLNIKEVSPDDPRLGASTAKDEGVVVDDVVALPEGNKTSVRRKRDAFRAKRATGTGVTLSCLDGSARCFQYKCKIGNLNPESDFVKIIMDSRLWESTLLMDYSDASDVQLISFGNVTIARRLKITQDPSNDMKKGVTNAIPDYETKSGQKVQWWIILVAVLVGLLVLLVVIFVLYKFGFFKRKRQEDMKMYKAEKKQQAMLTDYDDEGL